MSEPQKFVCWNYISEFDLVRNLDIGSGEESFELTQRISFEIENVTEDEVDYRSRYQFVEDDGAPKRGSYTLRADGYDLADTIDVEPSEKRKKVIDLKTPLIKLKPGARAYVTWEYSAAAESETRTYISFGMVTDRVVIRAKTPDDIEFVVDPIEGPDETKPSEWIFNRRFQIEQHIPLGWVKREQN